MQHFRGVDTTSWGPICMACMVSFVLYFITFQVRARSFIGCPSGKLRICFRK